MGRLHNKINAIRAQIAEATDPSLLIAALNSLTFMPSYLQKMSPRDPMKGEKRFQTTHVAKRSGRAMPCTGTIGAVTEFPFRVARLQKIRNRRHETA